MTMRLSLHSILLDTGLTPQQIDCGKTWTITKMLLGLRVKRSEAEKIIAALNRYTGRQYQVEDFLDDFLTELPQEVIDAKLAELNELHRQWQEARGTEQGPQLARRIIELKQWLKKHDVFIQFYEALNCYASYEW
ncbi:hypothetical protein EI42_01256 [Thermosporothrix hazakensis]|jgi:hypothetical protein|uniref:Uncharacterized protein n=2 Tax=Thermosporothrix TaxID=768650 RepID=A0A326UCS3_THEHA|nr:hypothetical protein [Thermosporothrix hazakensis]PZW34419.1 hypothetical protein EI42_01256 [Thermosporothrix hazakensis]BBH85542.1 hypothetical protein KTC_02930 [Thermosporothrix sp. COM3]GCE46031.1 hypothetical protein KTH_09000 [Thermosporothrix hazakensis]